MSGEYDERMEGPVEIFSCEKCGAKWRSANYEYKCPAPTSQPQGELRERERKYWFERIRMALTHGVPQDCYSTRPNEGNRMDDVCLGCESLRRIADVERLLSDRDAEVAATIERCAEIVDTMWIEKDNARENHLRVRTATRVRNLATAPQTSALAVKMAEARLEALREATKIQCHYCAQGLPTHQFPNDPNYYHHDTSPCHSAAIWQALAAAKER